MSQDYRELQGTDYLSDSRGYLNDTTDALRTSFAGTSPPSNPVAYQYWLDTATGYVKERNAANDAWIVVGLLGQPYNGCLPLAGGTMSGGIDMGGQVVSNLGLGTGTAAARQQELDLKAPIAAPALTGDATVNQDPAGSNSLVRRSWAEGRYLKLAGGTLTGALTLAGNAAADLQAVPYQQLRDMVLFNTTSGHRHTGSDSRQVIGDSIASRNSGGTPYGVKRYLVADGAGASTFGYSDWRDHNYLVFGYVAANGTILGNGSGNWTSGYSAGVYTITVNAGVMPGGHAGVVTIIGNSSVDAGKIPMVEGVSATVTKIRIWKHFWNGALGDLDIALDTAPFAFAFFYQ